MYKVGVVGLGNIASSYSNPDHPAPYCHVGGIHQSDQVELAAVADPYDDARGKFRETWGPVFPNTHEYDTTASMLETEDLDIVAVCVRGPSHHEVMMDVIESGPRAIFLEKPPSCSLAEMDDMVAAAKKKHIPVTVSYSRHWNPQVMRLEELVKDGVIGEVQAVIGWGGGTFLSFASHTTDLVCQFAGYCPTAVYATGTPGADAVPAGFEPEPHVGSMIIEMKNGISAVLLAEGGEFGGMYCDVVGTEGRARVGMYIDPYVKNNDDELGSAALGLPESASVFRGAYQEIAAHLDGGPLPSCTDDNFVAVNEIGFAGIESVLTHKRITLPGANRERRVYANG